MAKVMNIAVYPEFQVALRDRAAGAGMTLSSYVNRIFSRSLKISAVTHGRSPCGYDLPAARRAMMKRRRVGVTSK